VIGTQAHAARLAYLAAGIVVGVALGVFGLRRTKFEVAQSECFYTPNAHVGIALSLLLFGRIIYRVFQVASMPPEIPHRMGGFAGTPITLSIFGLLAGYYVSYAMGLLRWRSCAPATDSSLEAKSTEA
jgi:cytochrome b561